MTELISLLNGAKTCFLHRKAQLDILLDRLGLGLSLGQLTDRKFDRAPFRRVFDRVGKKVDQDLVQPQLVADQLLRRSPLHMDLEALLLGLRLGHQDDAQLL